MKSYINSSHKYKDVNEDCLNFSNLLFSEIILQSKDPFFPSAARDLFSAYILRMIAKKLTNPSIYGDTLNNKVMKEQFEKFSLEEFKKFLTEGKDKIVLNYLGDTGSQQGLGVMAELIRIIRQLFISSFCEKGEFSIRSAINERDKKTIFIEYDLAYGSILTPIYRVLFDLAFKEALKRSSVGVKGNVYFVIDEFKLLPRLEHIEDAVNFGRSKGVKIIAGLQGINQLHNAYGEHRTNSIISGFSTLISFRPNDSETRKFISNRFGENIVLDQYNSFTNNYIESKRAGNTVEDWYLMNLRVGQAVIGLPNEQPFGFLIDKYNRR